MITDSCREGDPGDLTWRQFEELKNDWDNKYVCYMRYRAVLFFL